MNKQRIATMALIISGFLVASGRAQDAETIALVGGTVYSSPNAVPLADGLVVMSDGMITAVGSRGEVRLPDNARRIDCTGKTIVAGFWNSHVHFTEAAWKNAASAPAAALEKHMQEMLTRWGFTTVWDLGSDPSGSLALRRRINSGEVPGPQIFLAGALFPKDGHPVYLPPQMQLPEAATPDEAARMARDYLDQGLDGIKLFTGAYMGSKPVVNMNAAIANSATVAAHGRGKPVFAHPQNKIGVDVVVEAKVDVLAHTVPSEPGYTPEQLTGFKSQGVALIPTLALWTTVVPDQAIASYLVQSGVNQLRTFAANGGVILFGTDVGFTELYDTSSELEYMGRSLSMPEILASLTTNPATYFRAAKKGRVETGFDADVAVLEDDPTGDVRNLAKVAYTIRGGKLIYQKP